MTRWAAGQGGAATKDAGQASFVRGNRVIFLLTFLVLALYMAISHWSGQQMNQDADDLLKLHELRSFLGNGQIFDRTLPDILQPEPFVSHWPWIVDLPYALVALPASLALGQEDAISLAVFLTPLLLLAPTLLCFDRLVGAVGFPARGIALPVAVFIAYPGFREFAPGRIDYHNLQILLLLASMLLLLRPGRTKAFVNGVLVALAVAISPEFLAFHLLLMGVYAFDYVFDRDGGSPRLQSFGAGLVFAAIVLFAIIVPPAGYGVGRCDTYSAPFALALALAGAVFAALPGFVASDRWPARAGALVLSAALSLGMVLFLFPQCLAGPYADIDPQTRDYFLGSIGQEMSFLERGDFVLSESLIPLTVLFIGALAPAVLCLTGTGRHRAMVVVALFSVLAVVLAFFYFRYLRYVPFFSGIGILLVIAALLPSRFARLARLDCALPEAAWFRLLLPLPGVALVLLLVVYHLTVPPSPITRTVADIAGWGCSQAESLPAFDWPTGTVVLAPPSLSVRLLAASRHPAILATPHHPAARGIARVGHFLDPGTDDPRSLLDQTQANMVAVCALRAAIPDKIRDRYPFAVALMSESPPSWLRKCRVEAGSNLRLYAYGDVACPLPPADWLREE